MGSERLMKELGGRVDFHWNQGEDLNSPDEFFQEYTRYMEQVQKQEQHGCDINATPSWFRCLRVLRTGGHSIVMNSFGVDTHRVLVNSVPDFTKVLHLAIN